MDTMGLDTVDTMASVRLSLRLRLMPTCTADSMESVRLMPSPRLMPTCIEDMLDMVDTTDMLGTTDTHMLDILSMDKLPSKTTITIWNQRSFFLFSDHFQCLISFV